MIFQEQPLTVALTWLIVEIAALNWALVEFFDYNLVTELFGVNSLVSTIIFGLIGVAAVLSLADSFGVVDIREVLP